MQLEQRLEVLFQLRNYLLSNDESWENVKNQAYLKNNWFIPEFIETSVQNIAHYYLEEQSLRSWISRYPALTQTATPQKIGLVLAGNIPMVGFHDVLCCFVAGHTAVIKFSSKDEVLLKHLIQKMIEWQPATAAYFEFQEILKNCDAYIATGSNNSARYFEHYFQKYPHIIRKNRTSVAILTGEETVQELNALADDVFLYFGMGCRNITKIYTPQEYNFEPLLQVFKKYNYLAEHHKYKNNYDYQLALLILGKHYYMSTEALIIHENRQLFSPVSQLHLEYYHQQDDAVHQLLDHKDELQCIVGRGFIPFGDAQRPLPDQYADGVDTMQFLLSAGK